MGFMLKHAVSWAIQFDPEEDEYVVLMLIRGKCES
jgi:hypothetical protein